MSWIFSIELWVGLVAFLGWRAGAPPVADHPYACGNPIVTAVEPLSTTSGRIQWFDPNAEEAKTYELEYVPYGASPDGLSDVTGITGLSHILEDLDHGTRYSVYIRSKCDEEYSNWNGPYTFSTYILNGASNCDLLLPVEDNNCPTEQLFPISVGEYGGSKLGENLYLQSVSLVVEHSWVADLSLHLQNPAGSRILLSSNHGVGEANFGDPDDPGCLLNLHFTMDACEMLDEENSPYAGNFLPDETFGELHDGSAAEGVWKLIVCDKAQGDVGFLHHAQLNFVENLCLLSPSAELINVIDTEAYFFLSNPDCNGIRIAFGPDLEDPGSPSASYFDFPCTDSIRLTGLEINTNYGVFFQNMCGSDSSAWSCQYMFNTACSGISLREDFNEQENCEAICGVPCQLNGIWENSTSDDMDWVIREGPTPTNFTGPDGDVYGRGKYIYIESSAQECQDSAIAQLISTCLLFENGADDCHFSFWYHMMGADIGAIKVEISTNNGLDWTGLYSREGQQSVDWVEATIDLTAYAGLLGQLRISGVTGEGSQGDIAIDALRFYGTVIADSTDLEYFVDADMDGHGDPSMVECLCSSQALSGYATEGDDCDDGDPDIHPDAVEIPCNLIDENCNGNEDDLPDNPPQIQLLTLEDESCQNAGDGVLEIMVTGPFGPYHFNWGEGYPDTPRIEALSAGNYQVTVTDINGCVSVSSFYAVDLEETMVFHLTELNPPTCPGLSNGSIDGMVVGGNAPYTFLWNTGDTSIMLENIGNGAFVLQITDQSGCMTLSNPVIVNAEETFQAGVSKKNPSCAGAGDGSIQILPILGQAPYIYSWNTGAMSQMISGLAPGTFQCTITDANGCEVVTDSISLNDPPLLEVNITALDVPSCFGANDGSIQIRALGGTAPYFYQWSSGQLSDDLFFLSAGSFSVTVTDFKGCQASLQNIVLESPPMITISIDSLGMTNCPGDDSGYLSLNVSGGTPPYQYFWSNGEEGNAYIENLLSGFYSVSISDANGCKAKLQNIQIAPLNDPIEIQVVEIDSLNCYGDSTAQVVVECSGGSSPYWFNWSAGEEHHQWGQTDTIRNLAQGTYRVTVTDNEGCTGILSGIQISQPARLRYQQVQITHNDCFDGMEGSISLGVSGGISPYEFLWSNGVMTEDVDGLPKGNYSLHVRDKNGCQLATPFFTVNEQPLPMIQFTTSPSTGGAANGSAMVSVSGSHPPYNFLWGENAGGSAGPEVGQLTAGWYYITVSDALGCSYKDSVFIDAINATGGTASDNGVIIFPNPSGNEVFVLSEKIPEAPILYNLEGKPMSVNVKKIEKGFRLNLEGLPGGYYLLMLNKKVYPLIKISQ